MKDMLQCWKEMTHEEKVEFGIDCAAFLFLAAVAIAAYWLILPDQCSAQADLARHGW